MTSVKGTAVRTALAWLLATQAPLLVSCGTRERAGQPEETTSSSMAPPADSESMHPPPDTSQAQSAESTDERDLLDILRTAHTIAIRSARLARTRSTNDAIQAYATQIMQDHAAANARVSEMSQRLDLKPEPNPTSRTLISNADHARAGFETKRGDGFDRAYIENEIAFHHQVLDLFDRRLIPAASDSALKSLLATQRSAIEAHLDHANHIQASLAP